MIVSLPNGKEIDLPTEVLFLSDKEYDLYIQALMSMDAGDYIEDAFKGSSFNDLKNQIEDEIEEFPDDETLLSRDDI